MTGIAEPPEKVLAALRPLAAHAASPARVEQAAQVRVGLHWRKVAF